MELLGILIALLWLVSLVMMLDSIWREGQHAGIPESGISGLLVAAIALLATLLYLILDVFEMGAL